MHNPVDPTHPISNPTLSNPKTPDIWKITTFILIFFVIVLSVQLLAPQFFTAINTPSPQTSNNSVIPREPRPINQTRNEGSSFDDLPIATTPELNTLYLAELNGEEVLYINSDQIRVDYESQTPQRFTVSPEAGKVSPVTEGSGASYYELVDFTKLVRPRKIATIEGHSVTASGGAFTQDRSYLYVYGATGSEPVTLSNGDLDTPFEEFIIRISPDGSQPEKVWSVDPYDYDGTAVNSGRDPKYQGYNGFIKLVEAVGDGKYLVLHKNVCSECDSLKLATFILNTETNNISFLGITTSVRVSESENIVEYTKGEYIPDPNCIEGSQCPFILEQISPALAEPLP